ncbi:MAG: class I SAM-dependent methyltransferase [Myxococcales bacterium]|nr:class I SAM-dependent methyltransferase [Myxococcales bacterium]MCB9732497.1 class I SAM-dependent methyltransferase [Deltaproteobacteria bacterium]
MSTQDEVEVSYDVGNDFFRLWLDEKMSYTCALFEGTDNLEQAQIKKHEWLYEAAHIDQDKRVLDIGCGWGANADFLSAMKGVKDVYGITLSRSQYEECVRRELPTAKFEVTDYRDFVPEKKFDAVISICMMEHIATPDDVREGRHIGMYRDYFRRAWEWTNPGAYFGLQTILRNRVPRIKEDLADIGWLTYQIFPGGLSLRLEDIVKAVNPYWEIMEIKTRREHYQKTTAEWLRRMRLHEDHIRKTWGDQVFDDYDRYLRTCVRGFEMHYQSLAQYSLRRID